MDFQEGNDMKVIAMTDWQFQSFKFFILDYIVYLLIKAKFLSMFKSYL